MSSVIHQPHDKFLKLSLSELRVATEFFAEHLPPTVLEKINLATLKLENHSFIDASYKDSEADVVYSVTIDSAKAYLYLLCEHQSTVDRWIAFRLWSYMVRLMEMHLKQNPGQSLPLVYPLVIYTGRESWNAPLDIFSLFGDQSLLAQEWLLKPFQLLDIHKINDDDMRRRQWSGLVEFALKYRQARDFKQFLKTLLPWIRQIEQSGHSGFSFSKNVLKYVLYGTEARDIDLFVHEVQQYLSPELRGEIMTLAQQFQQRGVHQGEVNFMTELLEHRFKKIPESYLTRIEQADNKTLLLWGKRILDAKTLEEVFE